MERPYGLNLLDCDHEDPVEVRWVLSTVMGTLRRLFSLFLGPAIGARSATYLTHCDAYQRCDILGIVAVVNQSEVSRRDDQESKGATLKTFWEDFPKKDYKMRMELTGSTINKITPFMTDRTMRNIIGQPKNTINFQEVMDKGKDFIRQSLQRRAGRGKFILLGSIIVNLILIAALKRRDTAKRRTSTVPSDCG